MTRNFSLTLCVILCILPLLASHSGALFVRADSSACLLCQSSENQTGWTPQFPSVNLSFDNSDIPVQFPALVVAIHNETRAAGVAYKFPIPVDLTGIGTVSLWVKIQNQNLLRSLYLSVGDTGGNWRQFDDFETLFALEPGNWTYVVLDLSTYLSEPSTFNATSVCQLWLGSYDRGNNYDQVFHLDDISFSGPLVQSDFPAQVILPQWLSVLEIFLTYLLAFPLGVLVLRLLVTPRSNRFAAIIMAPIQIAIGLSVETLVFLAALITTMNVLVVFGIFAFALFAEVVTLGKIRAERPLEARDLVKSEPKARPTPWVWILGTAVSIGLPVFLMSRISSQLGWAPPNDSLIHAMIVSLVLANGHLGSSFVPISSLPLGFWSYPRGFYGIPTALSLVTGIYPGQSVMLVGASVAALLPALLFSTTLARTRSILWAAVSFVCAFFLPGLGVADQWLPSHDLLLGAFLVSTYPSLMGNLILLTLFCATILFDDFLPISKQSFRKWLALFLFLTACLVVTYYFYIVFSLLYLVLRIVLTSGKLTKGTPRIRALRLCGLLLAAPAIAYVFVIARSYAISNISLNPTVEFQLAQTYNPLLHPEYLLYLALVIATIGLAASHRVRRVSGTASMELFFVMLLGIHVAALSNATVYSWMLWMTDPSRSIIIVYTLTYVMIPVYLSLLGPTLGKTALLRNVSVGLSHHSRWIPRIVAILLLSLAISPSIIAIYAYNPSPGRSDILQVPHDGDFAAAQWLAIHARTDQLILNDLTVSGVSLTSFRALSVVNDMQRLEEGYIFITLPEDQWTLMLGADRILQHPGDYSMVHEAMVKYNIAYIYISGASRTVGLFGSGVRFAPPIDWTMNQNELIATYMANPNLKLVFRAGNSAVFESVA